MYEEFNELLELNSINPKKPVQVVDHRWFSYLQTTKDIIELWSYLIEFLNTYKSKKVESIKLLIGRESDQIIIFITLKGIVDILTPIEKLQKSLQTSGSISDKVYDMIIELGKCFANYKLSEETVNLLNGLSITNKNKIVGLLNGFHNEIKNKWLLTCSRNLNEDTFGINGLFKKLQIFDPFKKFQLIQDFNYYKNLFLEVSDEKDLTLILLKMNLVNICQMQRPII